ncbi:head maturation protease, ClpP-related [Aequorivita echinoideorum]|uniref:ATP-dependent Clp protease proteolytic subunit n=1 Tax=Aequorivita echinoideorum TaxID=1549647 RepID=A0ABS5S357_9FLAO|nr:head maturation protease, ClpP-related [Aequorivita echinoideorum]MBT0607631.1 Clp protease ClpP [Aequorivita echinoideorum]
MSKEPQPYFKVVKNEAAREATIYIYGVIGGFDWDTFEYINTADKFREEFKAVENIADTIHVRINSPGGYIFEGQAIHNLLYASEKNIITYNDGLCASMASLILLSGDTIKSFKNSTFMVHNTSSIYYGNKMEVEEQLKAAEVFDRSLGTILEEKLGITAAEVAEKYLNYKDNWFTAAESLEEGFYDELIEKKAKNVPKNVKNMSQEQMFRKYAAMAFSYPTENQNPNNTMSKPNSYPQLQAALGLETPLATNDNGSFLNEDQKATIENTLAQNATALKNATDAQATAEANLAKAITDHATALQSEKDASVAAVNALKAAATLAGVENLAENADATAIATALNAQINVLNGKPGASHTGAGAEEPTNSAHGYLNFNNSIYNQIKK